MKLKAILETLDGLDDAVKAFYTEKDGKFVLSVEGYDPGEIETLRNTMRRAKDEKAIATRELAELKERYAGLPDDFSVDDYNRLKDSGGGNIEQRLVDQRNQLTKEKDTAVKKVADERDGFRSQLEKMALDNAINSALAASNIAPAGQDAVRSMFAARSKVTIEGNEAIVTIDDLPAGDAIKSWASTEQGKFFVQAPANGGGGSGGNPGSGNKDYSKMSNTELIVASDKDPAAKAEMNRRTKI